jgi:hypothetical protein
MPVQLGVGQEFAYQGTRGGSSGAQIPQAFNPHYGAHPVNAMPVNPPRSLHPGYNVRRRSSVLYILIKLAH